MRKDLILYNDDGSETVLPFTWKICPTCNGHGKSSAYLGAFTHDELHEHGPEFIEDYIAGNYDRACERCHGGKIKVPDYSRISKADAKAYKAQERYARECEAEERAEQRFCYGWQS